MTESPAPARASEDPRPAGGPFVTTPLLDAVARHWRLLRLRGLAAIAFGVLVFHWPGVTLLTLTYLWAAYSLVDGLLAGIAALTGKAGAPRLWLAVVGLAGIGCAAAVLADPAWAAGLLVVFIAAWAIVTGAMQLWAAVQLRKAVDRDWILALDGSAAIIFGMAIVIWPRLETVALVWLVGWFAFLLGSVYLGLGFWLRPSR